MASSMTTTLKPQAESLASEGMYFQRHHGMKRVKKRKMRKKISLKFRHIILSILLTGGTFYFIQQSYLFLISWDNLTVKEILVTCPQEKAQQEVKQILSQERLGNIFLLNINHLRQALKAQKWVKDAEIRIIFPSSLKITITERKPVAVVKKGDFYLIDEEGVELEKIDFEASRVLPLLTEDQDFKKNYQEKLALAWECLSSLTPQEKEKIETIDLSGCGWVSVSLKNEQPRIFARPKDFGQKLGLFYEEHEDLEAQFGPLEYVDLRFDDRIYIKPRTKLEGNVIPKTFKEVQ